MGLIKFINNIRYLFRYNIKEIKKLTEEPYVKNGELEEVYYALDHIKYEIESDLKNLKKVNICAVDKTLEHLIHSNCSIARFGDGEINLLKGKDIIFQKSSPKLSQRLTEIICSNNPNIMIAIPDIYKSYSNENFIVRKFDRIFYGQNAPFILNLLNKKYQYFSPCITFPYINIGKENREKYLQNYYDKIRTIWNQKDIAIICGENTFKEIKYNIYDNARTIEYIYAPSKNAFENYDKILEKAQKIDKTKIIIIILGPTATVLSYDLANMGYRALDLGHLNKDYDFYMKGIPSNSQNIGKFFSN